MTILEFSNPLIERIAQSPLTSTFSRCALNHGCSCACLSAIASVDAEAALLLLALKAIRRYLPKPSSPIPDYPEYFADLLLHAREARRAGLASAREQQKSKPKYERIQIERDFGPEELLAPEYQYEQSEISRTVERGY